MGEFYSHYNKALLRSIATAQAAQSIAPILIAGHIAKHQTVHHYVVVSIVEHIVIILIAILHVQAHNAKPYAKLAVAQQLVQGQLV